MKTSKEIIGLPVLSIAEVINLGVAKDLLINSKNGTVDFVVVEPKNTFKETMVIPHENVVGIGEDAITIRNQEKIIPFSSSAEALKLLDTDVKVISAKVMTEKGTIVGAISEIAVDEDTGKIIGCQWIPSNEQQPLGYIPSQYVITFGRDMIIVDKDFKQYVTVDVNNQEEPGVIMEQEEKQQVEIPLDTPPETNGEDPLKFFADQQSEYLIGRRVVTDIVSDQGEVIAKEGEIVTQEIIELATAADKYVELTLNTVEED